MELVAEEAGVETWAVEEGLEEGSAPLPAKGAVRSSILW